jgi:hypothetical protein
MYNRYDPGLLDVIFELAGGGGGRAGRMRSWSALVLVLMVVLGLIGGYMWLVGTPTSLAAADIEDGRHPNLQRWSRNGRRAANRYQISGRLLDGDAVVFSQSDTTWRCAPLISGRPDTEKHPSVYYAASETQYRRSRAEDRFVGELYAPTGNFLGRVRHEATACDVPSDALLLIDDGALRGFRESGRSLLIIAAVVGGIALAAFLTALRKQDDVPAAPPTLPD